MIYFTIAIFIYFTMILPAGYWTQPLDIRILAGYPARYTARYPASQSDPTTYLTCEISLYKNNSHDLHSDHSLTSSFYII